MNRSRLDELHVAVNLYARDKLLKVNGERIAVDAVSVRDKVAFNANRRALGFSVQAIADSTMFPCAAEDEQGQLYFCLPKSVQNFQIQGRTLSNGSLAFSGDYNVTISRETVTTESRIPSKIDNAENSTEEVDPAMSDETPETPDLDAEMKDMESPDEQLQ